MITSLRFPAMGTDIELHVDASQGPDVHVALHAARRLFRDIEHKLSRFLPDSELSRLNREGVLADPSVDLRTALELALEGRRHTGGRFDPTVLPALTAAGYDRTLAQIPSPATRAPAPVAAMGATVTIDPHQGSIHLAPGTGIDLGAIAKGFTAELAADLLAPCGPCLVNAGGDIATRGVPQRGDWPVSVNLSGDDIALVGLLDGAMATSGRDKRRWSTGAATDAHHVIDPTTAAPAETDILRITIFAATAVDAEINATALMLVGADAAIEQAERDGIDAIVVTEQGRCLMTRGLMQ